jgi:predicted nucleotidyltransferase
MRSKMTSATGTRSGAPFTRHPAIRSALRNLDHRLREKFASTYARLILFGSRARGDDAPDSDVDVAVVFRGTISDPWSVKRRIIEETYPLLLETGFYIQPWPVTEGELDAPDTAANPGLIRNILREGLAV